MMAAKSQLPTVMAGITAGVLIGAIYFVAVIVLLNFLAP